MNINNYIFESTWVLLEKELPPTTKRVLLTNGDSIVIGSLIKEDDVLNHWIFDRGIMDGYTPVAWMDLPNSIVVLHHEKSKK